jgi:predicted DNA-binding transcriptional regulator YafY
MNGSQRHPDSQQLMRQWRLLRLLWRRRDGLSVRELAEELDVAKATIERDLATLGELFAIVDELEGKQKKIYRISEKFRELETLTFGLGEVLAIYAALADLRPFAGTPLYDDLREALEKIRGYVAPGHNGMLEELGRVFAPHSRRFVNYSDHGDHIDDLTDAIARRRICNITYTAPRKKTTRTYPIKPLRLVWHDSSLYLFACTRDRPEITTFAVHRIRALEKTSTAFEPPPEVDVEAYISRAFGIFVSDLEEEVEILFEEEIAWRIEEQTFHPDEQKHRREDGKLVYRVRSSAQWEIIPWVRSFGSLAVLVEPRVWRDVLRNDLEAAAARYR